MIIQMMAHMPTLLSPGNKAYLPPTIIHIPLTASQHTDGQWYSPVL